jgi:hypothetical protein
VQREKKQSQESYTIGPSSSDGTAARPPAESSGHPQPPWMHWRLTDTTTTLVAVGVRHASNCHPVSLSPRQSVAPSNCQSVKLSIRRTIVPPIAAFLGVVVERTGEIGRLSLGFRRSGRGAFANPIQTVCQRCSYQQVMQKAHRRCGKRATLAACMNSKFGLVIFRKWMPLKNLRSLGNPLSPRDGIALALLRVVANRTI